MIFDSNKFNKKTIEKILIFFKNHYYKLFYKFLIVYEFFNFQTN